MLTRAAPGSTSTSSSGNFFLITSAVAAAIGVQVPPVGPAEKTRLVFCWASAGMLRAAATMAVTRYTSRRARIVIEQSLLGTLAVREQRDDPACRVESEGLPRADHGQVGTLGD